jgi:hypothetical protein
VAVQFYADAAMAMLRDALAEGFKDAARLKKNPALRPLHDREDYKTFVAELETANKESGVKNQESGKKHQQTDS